MSDSLNIVAAQATSAREVLLSFDSPLTAGALPEVTFEYLDVPAVPLRAENIRLDGKMVVVLLNTEMTPRVRYRAIVGGPVDSTGGTLQGDSASVVFPGYEPDVPKDRQFDLWEMIPDHNQLQDKTGDLKRYISVLQEVVDLLLVSIDKFTEQFDIERASETALDLILQDLGNPFDFQLTETEKRRLLAVLVTIYKQKGTDIGIENALRFFLGIEAQVRPLVFNTLILGVSLLGVNWELGPAGNDEKFTFEVVVDFKLNSRERSLIQQIVDYMKPANTIFRGVVEPKPIVEPNEWNLGMAELNIDTILS